LFKIENNTEQEIENESQGNHDQKGKTPKNLKGGKIGKTREKNTLLKANNQQKENEGMMLVTPSQLFSTEFGILPINIFNEDYVEKLIPPVEQLKPIKPHNKQVGADQTKAQLQAMIRNRSCRTKIREKAEEKNHRIPNSVENN
jgi:hypothetical protein